MSNIPTLQHSVIHLDFSWWEGKLIMP